MKATLHYKELPQEDIAMVNLAMENGALAHFCASFAADDHSADPWTMMVKVIGTAGSTRYSLWGLGGAQTGSRALTDLYSISGVGHLGGRSSMK